MNLLTLKENVHSRKYSISSLQRVNSPSNSSRAATLREHDITVINDVMQCLFKRQSLDLIQVVLFILFNCNLKTILSLRLVSKGFQILISHKSKIYTHTSFSPLNQKAKVYLRFSEPEPSLPEKIEFAITENAEVRIRLTLNEILNLPQKLDDFDENNLNITLSILRNEALPPEHNGLDLLRQLSEKLSSNCLYLLKFFDKVTTLNISAFGMFARYPQVCCQHIAKNSNHFPNLRNLSFASIAMTSKFTLPSIPNLEYLNFFEIGHCMTVNLASSACFESITRLRIDRICNSTTINISNSFSNLVHLEIPYIEYEVTINFPESLDKLTTLTLPNSSHFTNLPKSLPNLKNLLLTEMPFLNGILNLGRLDPLNLRYLNINFYFPTDENIVTQIPNSFSDLTALHMKNIFTSSTLIFPSSLNRLEVLSIKEIAGTLQLPTCLPSLIQLFLEIHAFHATEGSAMLVLPHSMPNLVHLSISIKMYFDFKSHHYDPASLQQIFNKPIGVKEYIIELPHSLYSLQTLSINGLNATLHLSSQNGGSKVFIIDAPHDEITRKLLIEINKRINSINRSTINTVFKTLPNKTQIRIQEQPNYPEIFNIVDPSKVSIFERSCCKFPEFFSLISNICDLTTILRLRLISKKFYEAINLHWSKNKKPTVSFYFSEFFPTKKDYRTADEILSSYYSTQLVSKEKFKITSAKQEAAEKARVNHVVAKHNFAKENANIQTIVSIQNLSNIPLIFNLISDNQLRIIFKINNLSELDDAREVFLIQENREIFNKIIKLDLSPINISYDNHVDRVNALLTIVIKNTDLFPNIDTLILGNVENDVNLQLPNTIKTLNLGGIKGMHNCFTLRLLDPSKNLENLTIKFIRRNTQLILTDSFKNLKTLKIGPLNNSSNCSIANEINSLQVLTIGDIHQHASLKLPTFLNNLNTFTIGYMDCDCDKIELPTGLNNLTNLTIGDIDSPKIIFNPDSLDNLITLKLGAINNNFILPDSLPRLETMMLEKVSSDFKWPTYLDNLTSLSIGDLYYKFLALPNSLRKLTTLTVKKIDSHTSLILPDSLSNLEVLTIGDLGNRKFLEKCIEREKNDKSPYKLKTTIGNAKLVLPGAMNKLNTLTFGNIDSTVIIRFPIEFKMLKTVRAGTIENDVVIQQLELIKKIANVEMNYTNPGICSIQNLSLINHIIME